MWMKEGESMWMREGESMWMREGVNVDEGGSQCG